MKHPVTATLTVLVCAGLFSAPALAYVGPGLGLGVIGTLFGILAAIVLAVFGLFWYPIKRMFAKKPVTVDGHGQEPAVEDDKRVE